MNLLNDPWIPVRRESGARERIRPADVTSRWDEDPIVSLASPRADFDGALIQFLIGLVQTRFAPASSREWRKRFDHPPPPDELHAAWAEDAHAFELDGDGPRFMQALELGADNGKKGSIAYLLIESPGELTLKENRDHFIKRRFEPAFCRPCAGAALFCLQTNSPGGGGGGGGHLTGLRGGGPLTTLVQSDQVWPTIWLNILNADEFLTDRYGNPDLSSPADRFPWLSQTKSSASIECVRPEDVHPDQTFWSLPRRVSIDFAQDGRERQCAVCGSPSSNAAIGTRRQTCGVKYWEQWPHPLSPYQVSKKGLRLPVHGSPASTTYRDWVGLVVEDPDRSREPAHVIRSYCAEAHRRRRGGYRLWAFGFEMEPGKAKARRWVEARTPLLLPEIGDDAEAGGERDEIFAERVRMLIRFCEHARGKLAARVKQAFARRPKELRGDFGFLGQRFMERTEGTFLDTQRELLHTLENPAAGDDILRRWHAALAREALRIFEEVTQPEQISALDAGRVAHAWNDLRKDLYGKKAWQTIGLAQPSKQPVAAGQGGNS